jgi:hypothetical protein
MKALFTISYSIIYYFLSIDKYRFIVNIELNLKETALVDCQDTTRTITP